VNRTTAAIVFDVESERAANCPSSAAISGLHRDHSLAMAERGINAKFMRVFDGRMAFVPEGQADSSLARSAWDNATPKSRPVGCGLIRAGVLRADSMIGVTKYQIRRLKTFTLSVGLAAPDHTVPYGQFFRGTLSQALRAKLRSCCPSGTKYIRPPRLCLSQRLWGFNPAPFPIVLVLVIDP
jgi:hypothetical protein